MHHLFLGYRDGSEQLHVSNRCEFRMSGSQLKYSAQGTAFDTVQRKPAYTAASAGDSADRSDPRIMTFQRTSPTCSRDAARTLPWCTRRHQHDVGTGSGVTQLNLYGRVAAQTTPASI